MDRFIFSCVSVAMAGLGLWMAVWPAWIIFQSRDGGDNRPVTGGEIWATRALPEPRSSLAACTASMLFLRACRVSMVLRRSRECRHKWSGEFAAINDTPTFLCSPTNADLRPSEITVFSSVFPIIQPPSPDGFTGGRKFVANVGSTLRSYSIGVATTIRVTPPRRMGSPFRAGVVSRIRSASHAR